MADEQRTDLAIYAEVRGAVRNMEGLGLTVHMAGEKLAIEFPKGHTVREVCTTLGELRMLLRGYQRGLSRYMTEPDETATLQAELDQWREWGRGVEMSLAQLDSLRAALAEAGKTTRSANVKRTIAIFADGLSITAKHLKTYPGRDMEAHTHTEDEVSDLLEQLPDGEMRPVGTMVFQTTLEGGEDDEDGLYTPEEVDSLLTKKLSARAEKALDDYHMATGPCAPGVTPPPPLYVRTPVDEEEGEGNKEGVGVE